MIHSMTGGCVPDYVTHHEEMYILSQAAAEAGESRFILPRLTNSTPKGDLTSELECDSQWVLFKQPATLNTMPSHLYSTALALRCHTLPQSLYARNQVMRCDCGHAGVLAGPKAIIEHALRCYIFSGIHQSRRHQMLKTGITSLCKVYGIDTTTEPTMYSPFYAGAMSQHRPDIVFHIRPKALVTDVTIVSPLPNAPLGAAASRAAAEKSDHHRNAVHQLGHEFLPYAVETNGTHHADCVKLVRHLQQHVAPLQRRQFFYEFFGMSSSTVATFRALAVDSACRRQVKSFSAP